MDIIAKISEELGIRKNQAEAAVKLIKKGKAYVSDLTAEQMGDWAAAMGIEAVYIDKDTTIRNFKNELRWNEVAFRK